MAEVDAIRQEQIRYKQAKALEAVEEQMLLKMQIEQVRGGRRARMCGGSVWAAFGMACGSLHGARCLLTPRHHARDLQDNLQLKADQEAKAAAKRKQALEQRLGVQTQMVARAHIKAAEEDDKLRALELAQMGEKAYMTKVRQALQETDAPQWYGRKKFDWYS